MSKRILKELVKFEENQKRGEQKIENIWQLIKSIHSSPVLRRWVTFESQPLCPFVSRSADRKGASVHLLIAIPGNKNGDEVILPPWGYIVWQWPSLRLVSMTDISNMAELADSYLKKDFICTKEYAENIQKALDTNTEIPLPSDTIQKIFDILLSKSSTGKISSFNTQNPKMDTISRQKSLSEELYFYLAQAKILIKECGYEQLFKEWRRIYARMNMPYFSIAVVGEFSRGKSTLINKLLKLDILPVGVTPTTAMVTRILYGEKPKMYMIYPDGKKEMFPLNSESWNGFLANDSGADPEGIIQVEIPNEWLKQTGIQIIDTPGTGDIIGKRAELTIDAIASCDATLVAINASIPLSLTERSFIEQHIISRKIPKISIVLTYLDDVAESERSTVVTYVTNKVAEWAPEVSICSAHSHPILPNNSLIACAGPEQILNMLSSWSGDEQHIYLRGIQIKTQLKDLIMFLRSALVAQRDVVNLSLKQRQQILKNGEQNLEKKRLDWEDLRLKLKRKELERISWLEEIVFNKKKDIIEKFQYELRHVSNPKKWWEYDFPFRLRQEMMNIASGLEKLFQNRIETDVSWLEDEIKKIFLFEMRLTPGSFLVDIKESNNKFIGEKIIDFDSIRWYSRAGVGISTLLSYILFAPFGIVGIAVSIGGGIISEKIISGNIENQKKVLGRRLDDVLDRTLHDAVYESQERLQNIYDAILIRFKKLESTWFLTQRNVLMKNGSASKYDNEKLNKQIKRADELISKLIIS